MPQSCIARMAGLSIARRPALRAELAMWLESALAALCDAIVCISAHEMRLARSRHRRDMLVHIGNGVPREAPSAPGARAAEWPAGKRRVLFVGRFDRQKGVDVLIDALAGWGNPRSRFSSANPCSATALR